MKITQLTPHAVALEELAQRLARQRKNRGFRQEELAAAAGIGVATLRRMEEGRDAHISSWIKTLMALGESEALEALLPSELKSPRLAVQAQRRGGKGAAGAFAWGDEVKAADPAGDDGSNTS